MLGTGYPELIGVLCAIILPVLIMVAIARWVFRVNDIIRRLDKLIGTVERLNPDRGAK